jgi:GAF domain-containing protein
MGCVKAYDQQRREIEEDRARRLSQQVAAQTTIQEADVEKARLHMLDIQKKHNILDLMPLSSGEGIGSVVQPGIDERQRAASIRKRWNRMSKA